MVTPSDAIETPFAASAWDWSLTANCFDPAVMAIFAGDHYAQTFENICGGGIDPTDPASGYPADCGF
jgi:glutamine synthetase type III